jgi:hypothetical protein
MSSLACLRCASRPDSRSAACCTPCHHAAGRQAACVAHAARQVAGTAASAQRRGLYGRGICPTNTHQSSLPGPHVHHAQDACCLVVVVVVEGIFRIGVVPTRAHAYCLVQPVRYLSRTRTVPVLPPPLQGMDDDALLGSSSSSSAPAAAAAGHQAGPAPAKAPAGLSSFVAAPKKVSLCTNGSCRLDWMAGQYLQAGASCPLAPHHHHLPPPPRSFVPPSCTPAHARGGQG